MPELPPAVALARAAYNKAKNDYDQAWFTFETQDRAIYDQTWDVYVKARAALDQALADYKNKEVPQ